MDERTFNRKVHEFARRLVPRDAKILCAVSGGADSVAMLHALSKANEIQDGRWTLHVAHLDHQLRPESCEDAQFVQDLAGVLDLPCTVGVADVRSFAEESGRGIEVVAREIRYDFLADLAEQVSASVVSVAHTADDQAETVLHRMVRGTGLRGLAGIPEQRPIRTDSDTRLVRPMLSFRRDELREYLQVRGLAYREDATNADYAAATRNRVRHVVLPMLEKELNPAAAQALVQLAEQAKRAVEVIRNQAVEAMRDVCEVREAVQWTLRARSLTMQPRAIQTECVLLALEGVGAPFGSVGFERIEAAVDLAAGDGSLRTIEFPGGIVIERRGDRLMIRATTPVASPRADDGAVKPC